MTERCTSAGARPRAYSIEERSCEPTAEQVAAQQLHREQAAEREAEARRNEYYENGGDEGGMCWRATSDARSWSPMLADDPALKDSRRTAAIDRPIEKDPYGNAIIGAIAGGMVRGVGAAAAEALAPSAGVKPIVQHIATETAKGVVKGVAKEAVKSTLSVGPEEEVPKPDGGDVARPDATTPPGRSGANATCEPIREPNQSLAPTYSPLVIRG